MKDAYISGLKKFVFTTGPNSEGVRVCEGALISLLALGSTDLSEAPRQWRDIKKEVVDGTDEVAKTKAMRGMLGKYLHARLLSVHLLKIVIPCPPQGVNI